jgi:hypothetical protein
MTKDEMTADVACAENDQGRRDRRWCSGVAGDFYELSLGYFCEFYSRVIKRVFSLLFLRVLFSDLSKELSLFYLASFILCVISRVLVSDLVREVREKIL